MSEKFTENESLIFDRIIKSRRSIRLFTKDQPNKEMIKSIINAGLWAPFAGLAVNINEDFRKFYIVPGESDILFRINDIIREFTKVLLTRFENQMDEDPFILEHGGNFHKRLSGMLQDGVSGLTEAPCLIIAAEKKGMPPSEKQSLAHVMENMWLKATSLNLGFRLLSIFENLSENKHFCEILGIEPEKFAFNGCIIGYPKNNIMKEKDQTSMKLYNGCKFNNFCR